MRAPSSSSRSGGLDLRSIQARFLGALSGERDVQEDLDAALFEEPAGGAASSRWRIYREGYVLRLAEAIGDDYPAIRRITGDAAFVELCRRYLRAFPPSSYDIGRAGASLAAYLPGDPVTRSLPFLADLARFEWALAEAVVAGDVPPLTWSDVAAIGAERFVKHPLVPASGAAAVRSHWPLGELRLARDRKDEEIDIVLEGRPASLVVWRHGLEARWAAITEDEMALVEGALSGDSPERLLEAGAFGAGQDAPLRLVAALRRIVELGIVAPPMKEKRT